MHMTKENRNAKRNKFKGSCRHAATGSLWNSIGKKFTHRKA